MYSHLEVIWEGCCSLILICQAITRYPIIIIVLMIQYRATYAHTATYRYSGKICPKPKHSVTAHFARQTERNRLPELIPYQQYPMCYCKISFSVSAVTHSCFVQAVRQSTFAFTHPACRHDPTRRRWAYVSMNDVLPLWETACLLAAGAFLCFLPAGGRHDTQYLYILVFIIILLYIHYISDSQMCVS